MAIWKKTPSLDELREIHIATAVERLGIEFTAFGDDWLSARMPVDARTVQPFRILHGGASVLLAESIGSYAANLCVDQDESYCVGLDINANHIRAMRSGWVTGTARPFHIGKSTQIWEICIVDEQDALVCISRLTMSVLRHPSRKTNAPEQP